MKPNRLNVLHDLFAFRRSIRGIKDDLSKIDWDPKGAKAFLKAEHVRLVLKRYLNDEISDKELELWANLLEGREDVDLDVRCKDTLKHIIFNLANPYMEGPINKVSVQEFLMDLQ